MFRLVALSSFLVASAAAGGAVSSSSSAAALRDLMQSSRPQDALASVQSAMRSADHSFLKDRNLISDTCGNEMGEALQNESVIDLPYYSEEELGSFCTFDSAMTDIQCDVSKIPGTNYLVASDCDSNGHAYAEVTYVLSMTNGTETIRYEVNNLGICVGSSCTEDEVSDFFDLYTEFFQQFLGPLDDDTAPELFISIALEELGSSSFNSQTCADQMDSYLGSEPLINLSDIPEETATSACTGTGTVDTTMTDVKCDASKIPDANANVEYNCKTRGYTYAEVTFVSSIETDQMSQRYEVNNLGICVGNACTEDEVSEYFDSYSVALEELAGGGSGVTMSITLESFGSSSSSSRIMWSSSIFAGAVAVGLMLFWA